MIRPSAKSERWVALFLLAALLFSPPFLSIFGQRQVLSIPSIYVYLFVSWGLVIALAALAVEGGRPKEDQPGQTPPDGERTRVEGED